MKGLIIYVCKGLGGFEGFKGHERWLRNDNESKACMPYLLRVANHRFDGVGPEACPCRGAERRRQVPLPKQPGLGRVCG